MVQGLLTYRGTTLDISLYRLKYIYKNGSRLWVKVSVRGRSMEGFLTSIKIFSNNVSFIRFNSFNLKIVRQE